jgi:hypothetical protein
MANDDHFAQLKKGVGACNAVREGNRNIIPDLRGANFSRANLGRGEEHLRGGTPSLGG